MSTSHNNVIYSIRRCQQICLSTSSNFVKGAKCFVDIVNMINNFPKRRRRDTSVVFVKFRDMLKVEDKSVTEKRHCMVIV